MMLGIGLSLTQRPQLVGGVYSPVSLFASGVVGAFYDPSDLASMFQNTAGTIPAALDQPVGRMLDKSGNGLHLTQATDVRRPILRSAGGLWWLETTAGMGLESAVPLFNPAGSITLIMGYQRTSSTANAYLFMGVNATNNASAYQTFFSNGTSALRAYVSQEAPGTAAIAIGGAKALGTNYVLRQVHDRTSLALSLYNNGELDASTAIANANTRTPVRNALGTIASIGDFGLFGRFYPTVIISRLLTAPETAAAESWVAAKSGVML